MILQQLRNDAERLVDLPPSMYDVKPVKWIVRLDASGRCLGIDATSGGGGKRDKGKVFLVPFRGRTVAIQPLLLADKQTYTWGMPPEHKRAKEEHRAYLELLERCSAATRNADVATVLRFLRGWDPGAVPLPGEMQPDELTTFTVDGRFPFDAPEVRRFWARDVGGEPGGGTQGQCLVCGESTELVHRLPVPLKGIPNGQASGVHLVSANASAFESHGRSAALISPICRECGERFGKAANALLQDDKTHLRVGPVVYLFWAPAGEIDFVEMLRDPQPDEVRRMLESARRGHLCTPQDLTPFYATSLSAAISRAVVRGWLHSTVADAKQHLERWFRLQALAAPDGAPGTPFSIFRLAAGLYRDASREMVARVPDLLLHAALQGGPLPYWLLHQAVRRNQAEQRVTYPRAALIKAVFCSQDREETEVTEQLDVKDRRPAYLCGRLLAELEAIQRVAISPKATLVDRFYGTASSAPASVFGTLLRGAQPHLAVLRKNRPGAYAALQQRLEEIMSDLETWPRVLHLQDQALFALGYYHQRAEDRRRAREAKERRLSAQDAPVELADDTGNTE